jgi:hypothetical protein
MQPLRQDMLTAVCGIRTEQALSHSLMIMRLQTFVASLVNPNGIPSQSPGLRGTSYPGKTSEENHNPNGVVANVTRAPDENGMVAVCKDPQPCCGWEICFTMTQGRRSEPDGPPSPTLGWRTQSLWDWPERAVHGASPFVIRESQQCPQVSRFRTLKRRKRRAPALDFAGLSH